VRQKAYKPFQNKFQCSWKAQIGSMAPCENNCHFKYRNRDAAALKPTLISPTASQLLLACVNNLGAILKCGQD